MNSKFLVAAAMIGSVNAFTCTRPETEPGAYYTPVVDPSSLDSTDAIWSSGTIASGTASFVSACADDYYGAVVANVCTQDGPYTLTGCTAVTVCGNTLAGPARATTTAATATTDKVCADCASSTWALLATDNCAAWSTCGNQVALSSCGEADPRGVETAGTLTADTVCEDCAAGTWAAGNGNCATWTVCGIATGTTARAETQAPSLVLDRTCADCAANFWAATDTDDCAANTVCGNQADNSVRTTTTAATPIENTVCAACTVGSWGANAGDCTACTVVTGALTAANYECTSATDSRVDTCAATITTKLTYGSDALTGPPAVAGTMDTCTATCAPGTWDAPSPGDSNVCTPCDTVTNAADDATYTCQADTGDASRVSACGMPNGWQKWKTVGTDTSTDDTCTSTCAAGFFYDANMICTPCTAVTNEVAGATYTCTTNSDTRVSGCQDVYFKTVGACGSADTCPMCNAVTGSLTNTALTCTSLLTSRVAACAASGTTKKNGAANGAMADTCLTACPAGSWDSNNVCTGCTAITNKATSATITCVSASTSQLVGDCATGFYKTAGTADTCNACTDITYKATAATVTCTTNVDSRIDACAAGFFKTTGAAGATDTCTACTVVAYAESETCTAADDSIPVCDSGYYTVRCFEWSLFFVVWCR